MKQIDYAGVVLSMDPEQEERKQVRTQLQWDYGQVPALHRKAVEDAAVDIAVNGRKMTASVMGIGDALIRVKGLLAHGQFEEWCRVEFGMSERTAQNMMNVARTFAGKSAKISLLSDSTLYLLAAPSTPEPVREAVIAQAEASGRSPSVAEVRNSIRHYRDARAAQLAQAPVKVERPTAAPVAERLLHVVGDSATLDPEQQRIVLRCAMTTGNLPPEIMNSLACYIDVLTLTPADIRDVGRQAYMALLARQARQDSPAPAPTPVVAVQEPTPADDRRARLAQYGRIFEEALTSLAPWAELTGRHVATMEAERGLRKVLEITERELALLRGEVVEESEGWG